MIREIIHNEKGFTFLESLFQLIIFVLFASISLLILIWFRDIQNIEKMKDDVNWELFVYDLNQYNQQSVSGRLIDSERLQMELLNDSDGRFFVFGKSTEHLRKTTNKGGHEVMLPFVELWELTVEEYDILMKVVMENGTIRERTIVLPQAPE